MEGMQTTIRQKLGRLEKRTPDFRGWQWLPSDLLDLILEKLIPISDYVRFGAVCKHWRSVALYQKQQRLSSCHKQPPMLMVHNFQNPATLYSVTRHMTYSYVPYYISQKEPSLFLPYYRSRKTMCGYSHGWLAYADNITRVITLSNPFTGRILSLPPIMGCRYGPIVKVVLSGDPSLSSDDFEAVVMIHDSRDYIKLAHFRTRGKAWTLLHTDDSVMNYTEDSVSYTYTEAVDLYYYGGQFLVVTRSCQILLLRFYSEFNMLSTQCVQVEFEKKLPWIPDYYQKRLVESSKGDLLMVLWNFGSFSFKVFKLLHLPGDKLEWVEIESIGEDALFVSYHQAMCVSVSEYSDYLRKNCIYVVIENGVGIFDLGKQRMELKHGRFRAQTYQAKWITPYIE